MILLLIVLILLFGFGGYRMGLDSATTEAEALA